jgi:Flp pilus assembly protein CpaB
MAAITASAQRYWPRYLNRSVLAGLLCALLMLGLVVRLALWTEPKVALLVTTADLPIGAVLEAGHLDATEATLDEAIASGYLRRAELADVLGQPLRQPVSRGKMLPREAVAGPPPFGGEREKMSVPVRAEHAVGGALRPGDLVRIVQVRGERAETILDRAPIAAVQPGLVVTFALPAAEADRLLVARQRGELQLLLAPAEARP